MNMNNFTNKIQQLEQFFKEELQLVELLDRFDDVITEEFDEDEQVFIEYNNFSIENKPKELNFDLDN